MSLPELLSYDVEIMIFGLNSGNVMPNFTRPIALSFVALYLFKDSFQATVLHRFVFVVLRYTVDAGLRQPRASLDGSY